MHKLFISFKVIVLASFILRLPTIQAADIELTDACSLADAITVANTDEAGGGCPAGDGADTIRLSSDVRLRAELPEISSAISFEGGGYRISGAEEHRIFFVGPDGDLNINNSHMLDGKANDCRWLDKSGNLEVDQDSACGGAILNLGTIYISDTIVSDSTSKGRGGAIHNSTAGNIILINSTIVANSSRGGGAIYNHGDLQISGSVFTDNIADEYGGAIQNRGRLHIINCSFRENSAKLGGGIENDGLLSIGDSNFSNNRSFPGYAGGAIKNSDAGELSIIDSSFTGNSARGGHGGAIKNHRNGKAIIQRSSFVRNLSEDGGAISNSHRSELKVVNSSFRGNSAANDRFGDGGAIVNSHNSDIKIVNGVFTGNSAGNEGGGIVIYSGEATLTHVTLVRNRAGTGGGLYVEDAPIVRLRNSIIAGNRARGDCSGSIATYSTNLVQDGSCNPVISEDPMFDTLVKPEDGSPEYFPLEEGSPAIDAADSLFCPDTDIIGTPRPQGAACDIGAYELPQ